MPGHRAAWMARAIVVTVTLVLTHDLTFLARYGSAYGEALVHAGHGQVWTNAVLLCHALGVGLLLAAGTQLWRLRAAAHGTKPAPFAGGQIGDLARSWARIAPQLAIAIVLLLTLQENIERAAIGLRAADPAILASAEYPGALAIVAAVAIAVSFVVALFRWRRDALLARIRSAAAAQPRPTRAHRPTQRSDAGRGSILGRSLGLRAPPAGVARQIAA